MIVLSLKEHKLKEKIPPGKPGESFLHFQKFPILRLSY